jgi:hypothetical protein
MEKKPAGWSERGKKLFSDRLNLYTVYPPLHYLAMSRCIFAEIHVFCGDLNGVNGQRAKGGKEEEDHPPRHSPSHFLLTKILGIRNHMSCQARLMLLYLGKSFLRNGLQNSTFPYRRLSTSHRFTGGGTLPYCVLVVRWNAFERDQYIFIRSLIRTVWLPEGVSIEYVPIVSICPSINPILSFPSSFPIPSRVLEIPPHKYTPNAFLSS